MIRKMVSFAALSLVSVFALGLAGCGGNNSVGPGGNTTAGVREVNALVGASSSVNFELRSIGATPLNSMPIPFGETSGQVESQSSGHYDTIGAANGVNDFVIVGSAASAVATGQNDINPNTPYTMIAYGIVNSTAFPPMFKQFTDTVPTVTANNALVRLINVAPSSTAAYQNIALYSGTTALTSGVTYGNASGYTSVPAGTYNLTIQNATAPTGALALTSTILTGQILTTGKAYTIIAYGVDLPAPSSFNTIVLQDD